MREWLPKVPAEGSTRRRPAGTRGSLLLLVSAALVLATAVHVAAQERSAPADTTPIALPPVLAAASRAVCDWNDDPSARRVWERLRARYTPGDSLSVWTAGVVTAAGYVADGQRLGVPLAPSDPPYGSTSSWNTREVRRDAQRRVIQYAEMPLTGRGSRGMSGRYREELSRQILENGYARLLPGINADLTQTSAAWAYPPLEAELATHFVSEAFGRMQMFALVGTRPLALAFCARSGYRSRPFITGILELRDDTTLARASWRFRTPAPDERAGGQAEFATPIGEGGRAVLLPVRSLYWRRAGVAQTFRREQSYDPWSSGARDELPAARITQRSAPGVNPTVIWRTSADTARGQPVGRRERH